MEDLKSKIDQLEEVVKEGRQLLMWKNSIREFTDRLASLGNSGRIGMRIFDKEDPERDYLMEIPIFLVRMDLERLGTAAQERVEKSIQAFKMDD